MKLRLLPLSLCLTTAVTVAAVSAQVAKKPLPAARKVPVAPTSQAGDVKFSGDSTIYDDDKNIGQFSGHVRVSQIGEDVNLFADNLTYFRGKNQARATGNLVITTSSSTIRGALIVADFNTKIITITGNVTVSTHGKSDGITGNRQDLRTDFKSKASKIYCQQADWDYEDRQATLTGNLRMTQGANHGTCDKILYDEEKNVARLMGRVVFTDDKNRKFSTPDLTVYIDEGRIITKGGSATIPKGAQPGATAAPAIKPRVFDVQPAPTISNDAITQFNITPPPIPTPRPEPTEAPVAAPPADPDEPAKK